MSEWIDAGLLGTGGAVGILVVKAGEKLLGWKNQSSERRKTDSEAAEVIARTALVLIAPLEDQITSLTHRVEALESENTRTNSKLQLALAYIRELRTWVKAHVSDMTPPAIPEAIASEV